MQKRLINSQLTNYKTYLMTRRQLLSLAENVFSYKRLPTFIDVSYVNMQLVNVGSIAFFKDEVLGLLALPYVNIGKLDVYGRPTKIRVYSNTNYSISQYSYPVLLNMGLNLRSTTISNMNAKATVSDVKTDLRTTKEDLMSELKDSREVILSDIDAAMNMQIELLKQEMQEIRNEMKGSD